MECHDLDERVRALMNEVHAGAGIVAVIRTAPGREGGGRPIS
jgi:hypothetical protein